MGSIDTESPSAEETSYAIDVSRYDTKGFCLNYPLRRHRFEVEADSGSCAARKDWAKYVGPPKEFGGCNPVNGNFTAVVLPLCRPERLQSVAYTLEYAFLYDTVLEASLHDPENRCGDGRSPANQCRQSRDPAMGRKQIQTKIILDLTTIDKKCVERVLESWKVMISTTKGAKDKDFASLEDYVTFRIIDTGAPFVEAMMLFGMGMTLTREEDAELESVVRPCYAALGLANDYFSFDREYQTFKTSGATKMTNLVWLFMQWHDVSVEAAKDMVREATAKYETQFQQLSEEFSRNHAPMSDKVDRYLSALAYQISGNVVWSLNCPRYHSYTL